MTRKVSVEQWEVQLKENNYEYFRRTRTIFCCHCQNITELQVILFEKRLFVFWAEERSTTSTTKPCNEETPLDLMSCDRNITTGLCRQATSFSLDAPHNQQ